MERADALNIPQKGNRNTNETEAQVIEGKSSQVNVLD